MHALDKQTREFDARRDPRRLAPGTSILDVGFFSWFIDGFEVPRFRGRSDEGFCFSLSLSLRP